jgi:hypothetical protein
MMNGRSESWYATPADPISASRPGRRFVGILPHDMGDHPGGPDETAGRPANRADTTDCRHIGHHPGVDTKSRLVVAVVFVVVVALIVIAGLITLASPAK